MSVLNILNNLILGEGLFNMSKGTKMRNVGFDFRTIFNKCFPITLPDDFNIVASVLSIL